MTEKEKTTKKEDKISYSLRKYKNITLAVFMTLVGFWIGFEKGEENALGSLEPIRLDQAIVREKGDDEVKEIDFSLYWDVYDILKDKYIDSDSIDARNVLYDSINGMLDATGDPYTIFLSPEDNKKFTEDIKGSFEGIGAELGIKNEALTVIAPLEGSPAEKSGLRAGDIIFKINDLVTTELTLDEAVSKIRGEKGTEVKLTVLREGSREPIEITIERNVINVKSVKYEIKDNYLYLKISRFGNDTFSETTKALNLAKLRGLNGIILDLRNNPGGFLDSSIDIASKMVKRGDIVVIEEDSNKNQKKVYSRGGDIASEIKTVVLINEGSASAAEILAGALKDNRENVEIVGKQSFGKGSVQELIELPRETSVKITVARWLTPNGKQINNEGIMPDYEIELTEEDFSNDRDPQLDKAIEILNGSTD